jgi:hypothetical protein
MKLGLIEKSMIGVIAVTVVFTAGRWSAKPSAPERTPAEVIAINKAVDEAEHQLIMITSQQTLEEFQEAVTFLAEMKPEGRANLAASIFKDLSPEALSRFTRKDSKEFFTLAKSFKLVTKNEMNKATAATEH